MAMDDCVYKDKFGNCSEYGYIPIEDKAEHTYVGRTIVPFMMPVIKCPCYENCRCNGYVIKKAFGICEEDYGTTN